METHTSPHDLNTLETSRPYKIALTVAVVLVVATLTVTVLLIIIGSARQEDLQATLSAVQTDYTELQRTIGADMSGFPLQLAEEPRYSAAEDCATQIVEGEVQPPPDVPPDAYRVQVWGDGLDVQQTPVGADGRWRATLSDVRGRRVWVQIVHQNGYYASAPVQLALAGESCTHNHATLRFAPRTPTE